MRIIDDIPESEIIELFLGPLKSWFKKDEAEAWSPSFSSFQMLTFYECYTKHCGVGVYYSNTKKTIRVSIKFSLTSDEWRTIECLDFSIADPASPQKVQAYIRGYLKIPNPNL